MLRWLFGEKSHSVIPDIVHPVYRGVNGISIDSNAVHLALQGRADYMAMYPCRIGLAEFKGRRPTQEDRVVIDNQPRDIDLQDGKVLGDVLVRLNALLSSNRKYTNYIQSACSGVGSCAITCAIQGNRVYTANLGDSTAYIVVIDQNNKVSCRRLNNLHNPAEPAEKERISHTKLVNRRGKEIPVKYTGGHRLDSGLAVSRAIGDHDSLPFGLVHAPEVHCDTVDIPRGGSAFVLVACDGLTECCKTREIEEHYVAKGIHDLLSNNPGMPPDEIAKSMVERAIKGEGEIGPSGDNISVVITPVDPDSDTTKIISVFDGHGGDIVSEHCRINFSDQLNLRLKPDQNKEPYLESSARLSSSFSPRVSPRSTLAGRIEKMISPFPATQKTDVGKKYSK